VLGGVALVDVEGDTGGEEGLGEGEGGDAGADYEDGFFWGHGDGINDFWEDG
jgi:hypothetical protein